MKQTINIYAFRDAFCKRGRKDQFSYEGLRILFNYIEEIEQEIEQEIEMDVIGLCCEYAEATIDDLISYYNIDVADCAPDDAEAIRETVMEYIQENTSVCGVTSDGSVVYAQF